MRCCQGAGPIATQRTGPSTIAAVHGVSQNVLPASGADGARYRRARHDDLMSQTV